MTTKDITEKAVGSIITQWNGGERKLAGARASELVFGKGNKPDEKLTDRITSEIPGIREYIVAPSQPPVENVPDHGGNPNVPDQQNTAAYAAQNLSSQAAKGEQNAIDAALAPGREARGESDIGSTKLNPAGSDRDADGNAAKPKSAKPKS